MSDKEKTDKQAKREARERWQESRAMASTGDYFRLRELDRKLIATAGDTDQAGEAELELEHLKVDRFAIGVGAGALLLYLVAWLVSMA